MLLVYTQQNAFVAVNHFCDKTRVLFVYTQPCNRTLYVIITINR